MHNHKNGIAAVLLFLFVIPDLIGNPEINTTIIASLYYFLDPRVSAKGGQEARG